MSEAVAIQPSSQMLRVCEVATVPPGGVLKVELGDLVLAVFSLEGEIYVTDDACTHGPGSLSQGYICDDVVECDFHGGAFNIKTGEIVSPPCMIPLKTYPVTVSNGSAYITAPTR
jgi:nitrite reductase/ring-hydroxylating ferredoxin subunit